MSGDDGEDNATVVLDINKLKEELEKKQDLSEAAAELEFDVHQADDSADDGLSLDADAGDAGLDLGGGEEAIPQFNVVLFEFGSAFFEPNKDKLPAGFNYVTHKDVKGLSEQLKSSEFQVVVFNFAGDPKSINTLSAQIKSKFPKTKTIIIAKNLSEDKVKAHQASSCGATGYLNLPLDGEKLKELLLKIHSENN